MARNQAKEKAEFIEKLSEVRVILIACSISSIARATIYRWFDEDPQFKRDCEKAQIRGTENINDMAESTIIKDIKAGNTGSAKWWLGYHHADYKQKSYDAITVDNYNELTPEAAAILEKASRASLMEENSI